MNVRDILERVKKAVETIEGNHTDDEEIEFCDALDEELPGLEEDLETCFGQIDKCNQLLEQLKQDMTEPKMQQLQAEVETAAEMIDEKEQIAAKLEPEIIGWNPLAKLIRRDEELERVHSDYNQIDEYLRNEEIFTSVEMKALDSMDLRYNDGDKIRLIKYEVIQMQHNIAEMKI